MKRPVGFGGSSGRLGRDQSTERTKATGRPPHQARKKAAARDVPRWKPSVQDKRVVSDFVRRVRQRPSAPRRAAVEVREAKRVHAVAKKQLRHHEREEVRRFTQRTRRRRRVVFVSLGAGLGLVVFVFVGAYSSVAAVRTIDIQGTYRVDAYSVQAALAPNYGVPLGAVDSAAIRRELAAFPAIDSYTVQVRPPGGLVVRVVERAPIGVVANGSGYDLVDGERIVVNSFAERPGEFPVINLDQGSPSGIFGVMSSVLRALPADFVSTVDSISATTPNDVTLTMRGMAHRIIWGGAENSAYKAQVVARLIPLHTGAVATIDVSSPDSVIVL